ncbi:MAG: hypothetical protein FP820_06530 [Sulfurimonas sp.]|jgi:hypothetical protein|nr:hypothetical protein [Sulfurimonas sp.]MBU1216636.1 hypothetical protein [bacterium]MBU1433645.1 hypothetical protein [bacterium]MBU1503174.1 hypothetical protein [bacterium]MBU3938497.1 hypothetical protein [bacterium]
MKYLLILICIFWELHAGLHYIDTWQTKDIREAFRENVSDVNAILKRGEYTKIAKYKTDIESITGQIKTLSIANDNKEELQKDIALYTALINEISKHLQKKAPELEKNHLHILHKLDAFNKRIAMIGYSELSENWRQLSNIKNSFIKQPRLKLEKEFDAKWSAVVVTVTELYLDEEIEKPVLDYLNDYKTYFKEISDAYNSAQYSNLNKVKPLSYKIKAQLELLAPNN